MNARFADALREKRAQIRMRWIEIMLIDPADTPRVELRSLVYLIDHTLEEILGALPRVLTRRRPLPVAKPDCHCGDNPYLPYFRAGRLALFEALVWFQAGLKNLDPGERDAAFAALCTAVDRVAGREIGNFAQQCDRRHGATA
ncbi:MAG: hypothetical protein H3C27_17550 [Opitutaceae bacterium]|nr:hypothetical protein [Opitutaceae bacterium]